MSYSIIKSEILICPDLCLSHIGGRLRNTSSSILIAGLNSIVHKSKLINFNQYNLMIYIYDPHFCGNVFFCTPFRKAKLCGVPSRAIVKAGCAVVKKMVADPYLYITAPSHVLYIKHVTMKIHTATSYLLMCMGAKLCSLILSKNMDLECQRTDL
jgi:hypothetical protein